MPCFSASSEPWEKRLQRAVDHHVERRLGLGDPAHAVGQPGRAEAVLAEQVTLPAPAEHLRLVQAQVLDEDLGVPGAAVHRLDLADLGPPLARQVDDERRVRRLRQVRVVLGAGDEDGEVGPVGVGDEPLVPVEHPLLAVLVALGLDQRRVGAGDLRLGHGEARPRRALAQRPQVLLLLLVGAPVQQRVHVALVGRLAVEHPRPVRRLGRLGLDHRQLHVAEAHAAPLGGHVRQPDAGVLACLRMPTSAPKYALRSVSCSCSSWIFCSVGLITSSTNARVRARISSSSGERLKSMAIAYRPAPLGRPLLGERPWALLGVLRREHRGERAASGTPSLGLGHALRVADDRPCWRRPTAGRCGRSARPAPSPRRPPCPARSAGRRRPMAWASWAVIGSAVSAISIATCSRPGRAGGTAHRRRRTARRRPRGCRT